MGATVDGIPSAGNAGIAHLNPNSKHDERADIARRRWRGKQFTSIKDGIARARKTHTGARPDEVLRKRNALTVGNTSMKNHSLAIDACIQRKTKVGVQNELANLHCPKMAGHHVSGS